MTSAQFPRIQCFIFYTMMAWRSVFVPKDGLELIECAFEGYEERKQKEFKERFTNKIRSTK